MITYEGICEANKGMSRVDIKGKDYACVPERVQAFRKMCPDGAILTEIVSIENNICVIKATVLDENGRVIATGHAFEKADSSFINKTSYIENCETSAVGRALGMLGLGSEASMASAEEVANAINNQSPKAEKPKKAEPVVNKSKWILDDSIVDELLALCKEANVNPDELLKKCGCSDLHEMNMSQYAGYSQWMKKVIEGK